MGRTNLHMYMYVQYLKKNSSRNKKFQRFLKKSSKITVRMAGWRHWLTELWEHIPQHCYILHNHPYTSSSDILAGTIYSLHPAIPTLILLDFLISFRNLLKFLVLSSKNLMHVHFALSSHNLNIQRLHGLTEEKEEKRKVKWKRRRKREQWRTRATSRAHTPHMPHEKHCHHWAITITRQMQDIVGRAFASCVSTCN